jgi:hypothetical protein
MTPTDVAGLVERLRTWSRDGAIPGDTQEDLEWAADALEALAQERDVAVFNLQSMANFTDQLKADVSRLTRERDEAVALVAGYRRSFGGHVYLKNEDYAALALAQRELESAVKMRDAWQVRHQVVEDRWKMAESELAALKAQTCKTCQHLFRSPDQSVRDYCEEHECNCEVVGHRCGRWAKRETP